VGHVEQTLQIVSALAEQAVAVYLPVGHTVHAMQVLSAQLQKPGAQLVHEHEGPYEAQPGTLHVCWVQTVS
jgi:hypothetical protein